MSYVNIKKHGTKPVIPIFILSHGRAGTNWLAWAANYVLDSAVCVHEAPPAIKSLGLAYYHKKVSTPEAALQCYNARKSAIEAVRMWFKKKFYVEVNQNMFSLAIPLQTAFTKAKFAGLIRDGRDFVTSMMNKGVYQNGHKYLEPRNGTPTRGVEMWDSWSPVQKLAWHWQEKIKIIKGTTPDSSGIYRYEDFFRVCGFDVWCHLWRSLGISHKTTAEYYNHLRNTIVNRSVHHTFPPYTNWSTKDKDDFWAICGPTMKEFNYA